MIIDTSYFSKQIQNINQILWNEDLRIISIQKMNFKKFNKEEILEHYSLIFQNFPMVIENSSEEIGISILSSEFFDLYFDLVDCNHSISSEKQREFIEKRKTFDPEMNKEAVEDFIETFFHSLIYNYEDFLTNTMKQHYFVGINDEIKILLSILSRYKSVLRDKSKQIDIFWAIRLNKQISDLILEMIIEFIEQRLNLLTIPTENLNYESKTTYIDNDLLAIKWNGSQQELCELILELEKKKWIGEIRNGERRKVASSITKFFDITNTKKNRNSDTDNSFYQLLKGEFENNLRTFPFLERDNYIRKFEKIIDKTKK